MGLTSKQVLDKVDVVPYPHQASYKRYESAWYMFTAHEGTVIGYMLPLIAKQLKKHRDVVTVDEQERVVKIKPEFNSLDKRNQAFAKIAAEWKDLNKFNTLKGWRDELYTIYNPSHTPYMLVERAFSILLGVITYGVHVVGYIPAEKSSSGEVKFWIPRRSKTKPTFPSMLDNTVAGGIGHPYGIYETVVKECYEEAGLVEGYVKDNIKAAGVLSYMYQNEPTLDSEVGLIQPEVEYVYELELDETIELVPVDKEAEEFYLWGLDEVKKQIEEGAFKPNCALVLLDFFVRKGYLTPDNEPLCLEIQSRSHRVLPFPTI